MDYRDALTHFVDGCNMCTSSISCEECEQYFAINALENQVYLPTVLAEAELLHAYKVPGHPNTYSQYNEGWMDAVNFFDSRLNGGIE